MKFIRYPGGKGRLLKYISSFLPKGEDIKGKYIEPFVGGGAVFFYVTPQNALVSDLNNELIDLYKGIKLYPHKVWEIFESFPSGRDSYYRVRDGNLKKQPLYYRAARTLYLNRTCFKGMWRHNPAGKFNVGYGGEDRRWVINHKNIIKVSKVLRYAEIQQSDFENILKTVENGDFIFLDPPYKPGEKDLTESHYINGKFSFEEQIRLSELLKEVSEKKKIKWLMTNSSHPEIKKLYKKFNVARIPIGTGDRPGILSNESNEVLISNY